MIGPWQIAIAGGAALGLLSAGFGAGWTVRAGIAAESDLADEQANTDALAAKLEHLRLAAQEAAEREREASGRVDTLERENARLRSNLQGRTANVSISDACAMCRLGGDAVSVLGSAAAGSVDAPER